MSIFQQQAAFLAAGDVEFPLDFRGELHLAADLIDEEYAEWSFEDYGTTEALKECIDLIYVAAQYMNQAVGPEKAQLLFDAVHADNMNKCVDGKLRKSPEGKILKPEGYSKIWDYEFWEILGSED